MSAISKSRACGADSSICSLSNPADNAGLSRGSYLTFGNRHSDAMTILCQSLKGRKS
jgi:hypothetical protein